VLSFIGLLGRSRCRYQHTSAANTPHNTAAPNARRFLSVLHAVWSMSVSVSVMRTPVSPAKKPTNRSRRPLLEDVCMGPRNYVSDWDPFPTERGTLDGGHLSDGRHQMYSGLFQSSRERIQPIPRRCSIMQLQCCLSPPLMCLFVPNCLYCAKLWCGRVRVCQKLEFYQNSCSDQAGFWNGCFDRHILSYTVLSGNSGISKIMVLRDFSHT